MVDFVRILLIAFNNDAFQGASLTHEQEYTNRTVEAFAGTATFRLRKGVENVLRNEGCFLPADYAASHCFSLPERRGLCLRPRQELTIFGSFYEKGRGLGK